MVTGTLHEFIATNRDELIRRCKTKVAKRSIAQSEAPVNHGVPLFLNQLISELRDGPSKTADIARGASAHGYDLLLQGFTVSQVVHDYGDVCQSVTDLAVETNMAIGTEDFRTLNRCLDDAIAGAVTEHARRLSISREGTSREIRLLLDTALAALDALRTGSVGIGGRTGTILHGSLIGIRDFLDQPPPAAAPTADAT